MADLKPCPFCGRIPVIEDCGENRYFVRCKCGIAQDKLYWQKCDAVRRWNTRKGQGRRMSKARIIQLIHDDFGVTLSEAEKAYNIAVEYIRLRSAIGDHPEDYEPSEYTLVKASSQPRSGKWIKISPANIYKCSVCGQNVMTNDIEAYKFCHGCGAEIERRQNEIDSRNKT